ncbi:MAG: hypothetical protein E7612_08650 [Ruminococcaceae bacterium]|nr:hypothetical protein [Oscillospiraceae bacterium]
MKNIFTYIKPSGARLSECFDSGKFSFKLCYDGVDKELLLYDVSDESEEDRELYLGHTAEEILASGRDILGEALTKYGDPEYSEVKRVFPKITEKAFSFLSGPSSWAGVTVNTDGTVFPQLSGRDREPKPIFTPTSVDSKLGSITPRQVLLDGEYPILISLHTDGEESLEFLYFTEPFDTDRDPIVWIRVKKYRNSSPEEATVEYKVAAISREGDEHVMNSNPPCEELFLDALCDTVSFWVDFAKSGAEISIPEEELSRVARGAVAFSALTFTGDHPHYGHKFYGKELHDNFPPNYIWSIEAACVMGRGEWAKRIFHHMLDTAINREGRICYRQGAGLHFGASATEYAMLICLANKYKSVLGLDGVSGLKRKKLMGMCDEILAHCQPCPEFDGIVLVKMCAEADTNERVNVYLNNNLWAIRGFDAICSLLVGEDVEKFARMSEILSSNIKTMIEKHSERKTRFGTLVPFRFGYTAAPLTLSNCEDTYRPLTEEEQRSYFGKARTRGPETDEQDITENTYSNYRYYPEILCSMLLPSELSDNIVRMRESLGGEILGMTRFRSWIDNWPVLHYARFLIESGRIEKYLLLLYAHTAHHGRPDLMAYYEQITVNGEVKAHDCVPSLLTNPIMLGWMFVYERVCDGVLQLLSALPKKWYNKPFSVKGIGYSYGTVDIVSDGKTLSITFSSPTKSSVELVWRAKDKITLDDITVGREFVEDINGNRIILKASVSHINLSIK